jgi:hypothetical protein
MKEGGGLTEYARLRCVPSGRLPLSQSCLDCPNVVVMMMMVEEEVEAEVENKVFGFKSYDHMSYVFLIFTLLYYPGNFYQEVNLFEALSSSLIYLGEEFSILNLLSRLVQEPTFETP